MLKKSNNSPYDKLFKIEQIVNKKPKLVREQDDFVIRPSAYEKLMLIKQVLEE